VLPFLKRLENDLDFPGGDIHGADGPVPVGRTPLAALHSTSAAFLSACAALGFDEEIDKNAPGLAGWGALPRNVVDGVRINTALAYLSPNRDRPNLTIGCGMTVRRALFEGTRAIAVEVEHAGELVVISGDEIVLAAGAVMSAQLLLVSGVGPAGQLAAQGIRVVADLAGVGTRCADHPQVLLGFTLDRAGHPPLHRGTVAEVALDTLVDGVPVSLMPYVSPMSVLIPGAGRSSAELSIGVLLERTNTPARISLTSGDPARRPTIDYHYLESSTDRARLREAVEIGLSILDSPQMREAGAHRTAPAAAADLDDWIARTIGTAVHLCSSAPMGPDSDPTAVVDQYCRVRGVQGLRVVDTSVLPTAPSRGTAATAVLIGERAAAFFERVSS